MWSVRHNIATAKAAASDNWKYFCFFKLKHLSPELM